MPTRCTRMRFCQFCIACGAYVARRAHCLYAPAFCSGASRRVGLTVLAFCGGASKTRPKASYVAISILHLFVLCGVWRHERLGEGAIVSTVLCVSLVHVAIEYIVRVVDDLCEQPCHLAYTHAYLSLVWRVGKQSTKT